MFLSIPIGLKHFIGLYPEENVLVRILDLQRIQLLALDLEPLLPVIESGLLAFRRKSLGLSPLGSIHLSLFVSWSHRVELEVLRFLIGSFDLGIHFLLGLFFDDSIRKHLFHGRIHLLFASRNLFQLVLE